MSCLKCIDTVRLQFVSTRKRLDFFLSLLFSYLKAYIDIDIYIHVHSSIYSFEVRKKEGGGRRGSRLMNSMKFFGGERRPKKSLEVSMMKAQWRGGGEGLLSIDRGIFLLLLLFLSNLKEAKHSLCLSLSFSFPLTTSLSSFSSFLLLFFLDVWLPSFSEAPSSSLPSTRRQGETERKR